MSSSNKSDLSNITSFDTFIEHPSEDRARQADETLKLGEREGCLAGLSLSLPTPGPVWGWLVPGHPANPNLSVRPLALGPGQTFSAGREDTCSLVFEENMIQSVSKPNREITETSRLHFEIHRSDDKTFIVDRSENGTFVRGTKLDKNKPRLLRHGDFIAVVQPDTELFWYIDESAMMYTNTFPLRVVTKYLVGNEVGRGTFGTVNKGFLRNTFEPVALKFLNKAKFLDPDISSEVDILRKLNHPCVTKLKDVVEDKNSLVIVMEFAEGGELERHVILDRVMDRLSEKTAKIQAYQIFHAVAYIHSKRICHRDLKLSNILMTSSESETKLKISDFGISKMWSSIDQMRSRVGKF